MTNAARNNLLCVCTNVRLEKAGNMKRGKIALVWAVAGVILAGLLSVTPAPVVTLAEPATEAGESVAWASCWFADGDVWRFGLTDGTFAKDRWIESNGVWYWLGSDGVMATGLQEVGGSQYYFAANGAMQTGWVKVGEGWYYCDPSGAMASGWRLVNDAWYWFDQSTHLMSTGWVNAGNTWYLMSDSGSMRTGWALFDGSWYYLGNSGAMATGWLLDGSWYYLDGSGVMATGVRKINGSSYFFNKSGAMAIGWCLDGADWRYANGSGVLQSGWLYLGGQWYLIDPQSEVASCGVTTVGDVRYYFGSDCAMRTGWIADGADWYLASDSGALQDRWQLVSGNWYWLDPTSAKMATGWITDNGKAYFLDSSGAMAAAELIRGDDAAYWVGADGSSIGGGWRDTPSGRYYFEDSADSLGRYPAHFGLIEVDGEHYFIDSDSGMRKSGSVTAADGKTYFVDDNGIVASNCSVRSDGTVLDSSGSPAAPNTWILINQQWIYSDENSKLYKGWLNGTYYLDPQTGIMHTGWVLLDGKRYFFNASGILLKNAWFRAGGEANWYWYHSDSAGVMQTGWFQDSNGKKYYLAPSGFTCYPEGAAVSGRRIIDGKMCTFKSKDDPYLVGSVDASSDLFANRTRDTLLANVSWADDQVYLDAVITKANEISSTTDWFIACDNALCRVVVLRWDYGARGWKVDQCWNCNGARKTYWGAWTVQHRYKCNWADEYFGKGYNDWSTCFIESYSDYNEGGHLRYVPGKGYEDCASIHSTGETTTGWVNSGCYGLLWDNAKYIYDNVPDGSSVYVFEYGDGRVI